MSRTPAGTRTATSSRTTPSVVNQFNYSLYFNGSSTYVDLGASANLNLSKSFTIAAWVKPFVFGGTNGRFYYIKGRGGVSGILIGFDTAGHFEFVKCGVIGSTSQSAKGIVNQWQHIAWRVNSDNTNELFVNGWRTPVNGSTGSAIISTANNAYFGVDINSSGTIVSGDYFNGLLDNFFVYNSALTNLQIQDLASNNIDPGSQVGKYLFDEGSGTTTTDSGTNGYTGSLNNNTFSNDVMWRLRMINSIARTTA